MKKLLLSSVMMLFLSAVSFAQTERQHAKTTARMEAAKLAQQAQLARDREKILEVQHAKYGSNTNAPASKKMMAEKLALEESRNRTNAANASLVDPRAN